MFEYKNIKIRWLGHDSFLIQSSGTTIYLDPYKLTDKTLPKGDIVISSHEHHDHCHPDSINLISTDSTILIGPKTCQSIFDDKIDLKGEVKELNPQGSIELGEIKITAIPAYNTHRFRSPGTPYHPKESNHIGPIVDIGGTTIYHAGDTDKIPEMESLDVDIALLPVSGKYVMDAAEAIEASKVIKAEVFIPMHVGRGIGELDHRHQLKAGLPDRNVQVLDIE